MRNLVQHGVAERSQLNRRDVLALTAGACGATFAACAVPPEEVDDPGEPAPTLPIGDLSFLPETAPRLFLGGGFVAVPLQGAIEMDLEAPRGEVAVDWGDGSTTLLTFAAGGERLSTGEVTIELVPGPDDVVLFNGEPVEAWTLLESAAQEWRERLTPQEWSPAARAIAAHTAVVLDPGWQANFQVALQSQSRPSFWCKAGCFGIGAVVAAVIAIGCVALLAGCAGATTITIGGAAVPCAFVSAICVGAVFGGWKVAYDAWIEYVWGG